MASLLLHEAVVGKGYGCASADLLQGITGNVGMMVLLCLVQFDLGIEICVENGARNACVYLQMSSLTRPQAQTM